MLFIKDHVKSVLRISSAHNKWGSTGTDINIAQILHLSNFIDLHYGLEMVFKVRALKIMVLTVSVV
jgi:hypothetical protein